MGGGGKGGVLKKNSSFCSFSLYFSNFLWEFYMKKTRHLGECNFRYTMFKILKIYLRHGFFGENGCAGVRRWWGRVVFIGLKKGGGGGLGKGLEGKNEYF